MNIDNFIPSTLKITASEKIDIQPDLDSSQSKNIDQLLNEKTTQKKSEENKEE